MRHLGFATLSSQYTGLWGQEIVKVLCSRVVLEAEAASSTNSWRRQREKRRPVYLGEGTGGRTSAWDLGDSVRFLDGPTWKRLYHVEKAEHWNSLQFHIEFDLVRVHFRKEHTVSESVLILLLTLNVILMCSLSHYWQRIKFLFFTLRFNLQWSSLLNRSGQNKTWNVIYFKNIITYWLLFLWSR